MNKRLVHVYPSLFRSHGDFGNLRILQYRGKARGHDLEMTVVEPGTPIPAADFYVIGGGEDRDLAPAASILREEGTLARAAADGVPILFTGAGFRISGASFLDDAGVPHTGLDILPVSAFRGELATGPVVTRSGGALDMPVMSGYEHHRGRVTITGHATPLADLEIGVGNGTTPATDGAVSGRVVGTWMLGPVLSRNPELADTFLKWVLGVDGLDPFADPMAEEVRRVRLAEARSLA